MIKFYLYIQSKLLSKAFLYSALLVIIIFNILLRISPNSFIHIYGSSSSYGMNTKIMPLSLFAYCDVYMLLIFIIIIYFSLGMDFYNSMEEITLAIGGSKINIYMFKKFISMFAVYFPLYILTYINIYTLYSSHLKGYNLISFHEVFFYSVVTNIFIISLSLFILFLTREIAVSLVIITSYYLLEEYLWRSKVTKEYGILGHIFCYYDASFIKLIIIKILYLAASFVLIYITLKLSGKKYALLVTGRQK